MVAHALKKSNLIIEIIYYNKFNCSELLKNKIRETCNNHVKSHHKLKELVNYDTYIKLIFEDSVKFVPRHTQKNKNNL